MRAFLALLPSDDLADDLAEVTEDLRCGRAVDVDDLHLTLAFLGEVREDILRELDLALEMMRPGPVPLEITGLGTFGSAHPRLVYAAARADPALMHLQKKVETAARRAGADLPHSRFVPHVTLARFPHRMPPEDHARLGRFLQSHGDLRPEPEMAESVALVRSILNPDGARYEVLEEYPLS